MERFTSQSATLREELDRLLDVEPELERPSVAPPARGDDEPTQAAFDAQILAGLVSP